MERERERNKRWLSNVLSLVFQQRWKLIIRFSIGAYYLSLCFPDDCEIYVSSGEIFTPLRFNVIMEFAQEIVYVEDDQCLYEKYRYARFYIIIHFVSYRKLHRSRLRLR